MNLAVVISVVCHTSKKKQVTGQCKWMWGNVSISYESFLMHFVLTVKRLFIKSSSTQLKMPKAASAKPKVIFNECFPQVDAGVSLNIYRCASNYVPTTKKWSTCHRYVDCFIVSLQ